MRFTETSHTIPLDGKHRPVLELEGRLYVGETLCLLNPAGHGGRVWSGRDMDSLKYNVHFKKVDADGSDH